MTQALIARLALAEQWAMQNGAPASVTDALKDAAAGAREAAGMVAELAVLSSKQEQGEAVQIDFDWPDYHYEAMGCGLEDRGITDRYEAMRYGWDSCLDRCAEAAAHAVEALGPLYTRPQQGEAAPAVQPGGWQEEAELCIFLLSEIGALSPEDIESDSIEITGEDAQGRDACCECSITETADRAAKALRAAIAAKGGA